MLCSSYKALELPVERGFTECVQNFAIELNAQLQRCRSFPDSEPAKRQLASRNHLHLRFSVSVLIAPILSALLSRFLYHTRVN
jgi:hypothetical protein